LVERFCGIKSLTRDDCAPLTKFPSALAHKNHRGVYALCHLNYARAPNESRHHSAHAQDDHLLKTASLVADRLPEYGRADPLLNTSEAAEYLGTSRPTLERWRADRRGPPVVYLGKRIVRYRQSDLDEFIRACTFAGARTPSR
jgi:excisionase family DNA binding protein